MTTSKLRILLLLALTAPVWSQPRLEIERRYAKAASAVRLKYTHGLMSVRHPEFAVYNPQGEKLDLTLEGERFELLFTGAIALDLNTTIVDFKQLDARHARCGVSQKMVVERVNPENRRSFWLVLETRAADDWTLDGSGWRQRLRRLRAQQYTRRESKP